LYTSFAFTDKALRRQFPYTDCLYCISRIKIAFITGFKIIFLKRKLKQQVQYNFKKLISTQLYIHSV